MIIRNLSSDNKDATITLGYDELRCLCNSLYEISTNKDIEKDPVLNVCYRNFLMLFCLVKHANIPNFELKTMYKIMNTEEHEEMEED